MRFLLPSILFIGITGFTYAQNNPGLAGYGVEANYAYGKVFKHSKRIKAPIPDHSTSFELNFIQQTDGRKDWHIRRKYPLVGFGIAFTDYNSKDVLGKCISIYPNLQLPIIRGKHVEWTFRAAFGIGYATKRFERYANWDTLNNAIASHINNYSTFATDFRYHIDQHIDIQVGGMFSHISDACLRQPNRGINLYGVRIGIRYFPATRTPEKIYRKLSPLKNRWLLQARIGLGGEELTIPDGPIYPIYIGSLFMSKRYASKNKVFAGIDYSYHTSMYAFLRTHEIDPGNEKANSWKSALFAGNEFLIGRVGIVLQVGYYLKQNYIKRDRVYEKLGGNFYILQNEKGMLKELALSVLLKTHKAEAEFAELGLCAGF